MRTSWLGLVAVAACAHNVPQDRATGPDGRAKGAQPIALEQGEGTVRGIVTYPGGDRVDWKRIELPEGTRGRLDLQMSWTTPRPGLKVAFDVFDQWNIPVVNASASARAGRMRSATIDRAKGTYHVRIYAPRRGDAGAYTLRPRSARKRRRPTPACSGSRSAIRRSYQTCRRRRRRARSTIRTIARATRSARRARR